MPNFLKLAGFRENAIKYGQSLWGTLVISTSSVFTASKRNSRMLNCCWFVTLGERGINSHPLVDLVIVPVFHDTSDSWHLHTTWVKTGHVDIKGGTRYSSHCYDEIPDKTTQRREGVLGLTVSGFNVSHPKWHGGGSLRQLLTEVKEVTQFALSFWVSLAPHPLLYYHPYWVSVFSTSQLNPQSSSQTGPKCLLSDP